MKQIVLCAILWCTLSVQGQPYSYYVMYDSTHIVTITASPADEMGGVELDTLQVYTISPETRYYTRQLSQCQIMSLIQNGIYNLPDSLIRNYIIGKTVIHRQLYIQDKNIHYKTSINDWIWIPGQITNCCILLVLICLGLLVCKNKKIKKNN